jgi:TnpA family transposase
MPRRERLSRVQRIALIHIPTDREGLAHHYTLTGEDRALIAEKRADRNRLGFAVQLAYLRYPGQALGADEEPPAELLAFLARQLEITPAVWAEYASRDETRREHALELQAAWGLRPFTVSAYRGLRGWLTELALRTHKPLALAEQLIERLRSDKIIVPPIQVIDRLCGEASARGTRTLYRTLTDALDESARSRLDALLISLPNSRTIVLTWLRQPPGEAKPGPLLRHLSRLARLRELALPADLPGRVHPGRLAELARQGAQMSVQHLRDLETARRYATLVALALDTEATITDQILEQHDRFIGRLFAEARRKHEQRFAAAGKAINDKVRMFSQVGHALIDARGAGTDPYTAIESVVTWELFTQSVAEADSLARPAAFDSLPLLGERHGQVRRYAPRLLETFDFKAAPIAQNVIDGIDTLRAVYRDRKRALPEDAPIGFVRKSWEPYVMTAAGLDRPLYELAALTELRNSLRSGDVWVAGSRQFKDFEDYLMPPAQFERMADTPALAIAIEADGDHYLDERLRTLETKLKDVDTRAQHGELAGVDIVEELMTITPHKKTAPHAAELLEEEACALLPHVKITELLLEVDRWCSFTRHFTHLRTDQPARDRAALLTVVLADTINLGLSKMAESCPGSSFHRLDTLRAWHVRDETYSKALAELVNFQHALPFAAYWGPGTRSSSDGQRFAVGGRGEHAGSVNLRYGTEPGLTFYTHISDRYAPFHTKVISATVRDATHVLDGLLYHESDIRIEEHSTDTLGFTDHVFFLCHALGFRFAPRIRDLGDRRLYLPDRRGVYSALAPFIAEPIRAAHIRTQWKEVRRLVASIRHGNVTASLILRKLGSYPRQNGLALALRELGRIERTLFVLEWLSDADLRRRVTAILNKGELRNTLARAVCLNRLGEIRDRTFEAQRHRASGLNLVTAAIILWNTVYLERAILALHDQGRPFEDAWLQHIAPVHWNHINLTGDYSWRPNKRVERGGLRPLRLSRA